LADEADYEPLKPNPLTLKVPVENSHWDIKVKVADLGMGRRELFNQLI